MTAGPSGCLSGTVCVMWQRERSVCMLDKSVFEAGCAYSASKPRDLHFYFMPYDAVTRVAPHAAVWPPPWPMSRSIGTPAAGQAVPQETAQLKV